MIHISAVDGVVVLGCCRLARGWVAHGGYHYILYILID